MDQCDPEVYKNGEAIVLMHSIPAKEIERLIRQVAKRSGQKVDWHYVGGRAVVRYIGDRAAVAAAITEITPEYEEMLKKAYENLVGPGQIPKMYWFEV